MSARLTVAVGTEMVIAKTTTRGADVPWSQKILEIVQ